ncbi:MAG: hypothetical protein ONB46_18740 [candidate division KSB1 bacterium]|nr:hypothetical protein [candidate division KSB1 bacterium]MDZ7367919.1 hypothetical protein [candidate division KSB1 bacterium]MDZ7406514.1 hypothetical protein [candidate division KSB1 bacterium]
MRQAIQMFAVFSIFPLLAFTQPQSSPTPDKNNAREKQLDSLYATQKIDTAQLRAVVGDIARLQGELRFTHLNAHLEMKKILSRQQVAKYDELRGYGKGKQGEHPLDKH